MGILSFTASKPISNKLKEALATTLDLDSTSAFAQIPSHSDPFTKSAELAAKLKSQYDQFVVIGIGGSSMGSRALVEVTKTENIYFVDNVDSDELDFIWKKISPKLAKTAFICVSKSGTTIEILWNLSTFESLYKKENHSLIQQTYFITENTQNPLADFAHKHNRPMLEVPLKVGGRFSVLTPVGLLIAKLCELNLDDIKTGAQHALSDTEKVLSICQLFLDSFNRHENITLFWFYNSNFRWFGGWLQQLWAESLGKKLTRHGKPAPSFSSPMIAIGSCDQHSILQQVAHGPKDKYVCIFNFSSVEQSPLKIKEVLFAEIDFMVNKSYGDLISYQSKATHEALKQNGVSCDIFSVDSSNLSKSMGYLFMFFQLVVATIGEHEDVNAYDQPGVALGKEITLSLLKKSN